MKKKHPGGRPTKYDPSLVHKIDAYIKTCVDKRHQGHIEVNLPTMEGLSQFLDVSRATIFKWAEVYTEFSDSLEKINVEQKRRLLNMGLSGAYNSKIATLVLSHNHKMSEKTETDITSRGEKVEGFVVSFVHETKDKNPAGV